MEHDTAGDPTTGLKWTRKTPQKIAQLLEQVDIPVSANTVARLLHSMNYSLRANHKNLASAASPFRDQQFQYISSLRHSFQRHGLPMISVDTKKRELVVCPTNNLTTQIDYAILRYALLRSCFGVERR